MPTYVGVPPPGATLLLSRHPPVFLLANFGHNADLHQKGSMLPPIRAQAHASIASSIGSLSALRRGRGAAGESRGIAQPFVSVRFENRSLRYLS